MRASAQTGFTLLEVLIAVLILALSLTVLLESQASSMQKVGRARDMTIAALLARSKMIDIEQQLIDEGFKIGDEEEQGDFEEEGRPEYKWAYSVSEVELELGNLGELCGGFGEAGGDQTDCDGMFGMMGGTMDAFVETLGTQMRAVDLTVKWPVGRYQESMSVRSIVTRGLLGSTVGGTGVASPGATQQRNRANRQRGRSNQASGDGG